MCIFEVEVDSDGTVLRGLTRGSPCSSDILRTKKVDFATKQRASSTFWIAFISGEILQTVSINWCNVPVADFKQGFKQKNDVINIEAVQTNASICCDDFLFRVQASFRSNHRNFFRERMHRFHKFQSNLLGCDFFSDC
jgi:hypothetical protein